MRQNTLIFFIGADYEVYIHAINTIRTDRSGHG
jgi:hypothetical protein